MDHMAGAKRKSGNRASMTPGDQAESDLEKMLEAADPAAEAALETLRVSEEHYFAAVHQEGNPVPTTYSSSTEI